MIRRTPVLATTAVLATVALSACGGSDTKAAPNPTTTVSVATASATSTTPVATTSNSAVAAAPSTSGTQAATTPIGTATVTRTASARPTATATVTRGAVPTKAASTKAGDCRTSDGTLLNLDGVSCGFAQNGYAVFKANRDYLMRAYSPTAHKYYTFTCSEDGVHIVACGGGTMNPNSLFSWQD